MDNSDDTLRASRASQQYNAGYSKTIRLLRLILPVIALIMIAVVFVWPNLDKTNEFVIEQQEAPSLKEATNELLNPRFESVDKNGNPFIILAEKATQSPNNENRVMLENPTGDITLTNNAQLKISAQNGAYEQAKGTLNLEGQVDIAHSDGYRLQTTALNLDFENNQFKSDQTVDIKSHIGTLNAAGVHADGKKSILTFTGPARLTLYQDNTKFSDMLSKGTTAN